MWKRLEGYTRDIRQAMRTTGMKGGGMGDANRQTVTDTRVSSKPTGK